MERTIGVPHGKITITLTFTVCLSVGKAGIGTIHITHLTRQEGGTVKGTIELVDTGGVGILHIDGMETLSPKAHITIHHLRERQVGTQITPGTVGTGERGSHTQFDGLSPTSFEGQRLYTSRMVRINDFIAILQYQMTTETGSLAPSLIDAVNRIPGDDHVLLRIMLDAAFTLIIIRIDDDMHRSVLHGGHTENGTMTQCRHLYQKMLVGQDHLIIIRMRHFLMMTETRGALFGLQA